jgi:DNA-binding CsgD family transcriptional regulator
MTILGFNAVISFKMARWNKKVLLAWFFQWQKHANSVFKPKACRLNVISELPLLTEKERRVLLLAAQGLSDYKIARRLNSDPPTITRSRKNAVRKLLAAQEGLKWAANIGYSTTPETARAEVRQKEVK